MKCGRNFVHAAETARWNARMGFTYISIVKCKFILRNSNTKSQKRTLIKIQVREAFGLIMIRPEKGFLKEILHFSR